PGDVVTLCHWHSELPASGWGSLKTLTKSCLCPLLTDERDRVQKKTFTKWVNKHLMKVRKHINDLYEDLRDGHNLISLLEVLSGVKLPREKGRMRFHRLQNVQIALDFLKQRQVKLVNIRNDDITDGNPKLTLGLIWTIILHFQISDIYISGESGDMSAKEKLLLWTQKVTAGYIGVKCTNFSSCWSDGKMFNALIHRYRPDLVDMERVQIQSNRENLEQAFEIAERLGVTRLLDAEDVDVPSPDEKSVITYVSSIYDAFPKVPEGGEGISAIEVDSRWLEYQSCVESLISWIKQHTILMSDKSFPQNPVELKALYNQYIHFKETEIPAKEQEKGRIEELYKLLEVWIEFGRIKLPQGYHPNDVEEEWGKLIIEMLEREKLLRPAVERLELLLQIANKIQNGALSCEEKLTLAKNTLQADAAHLESGQPVQYESDVVVYLQECEGLIRQLQVDVQILRDENYYQLEELVIMRLQDELVTLRLECTNLYRKGHFSTLELVPTSTLSTTHLKGESLTKGLHTSSTSWFRKPMTRTELVAISSSEDEGSLRFVYELLAWVEEMQVSMRLERAEWGTDLPSVETQLETQRHIHTSVEDLGSSVKEARMYEGKMSQNFRASYTETLGKLETQYCKLMETSSFRLRHLQSLHGFVSRATVELIWLNEKEEEELAYDWSDNNPNIAAKKNYFSELTTELEEKQDVFRSLQDTAELLSLENHPAKQTVEAYSAAVQSQWQWIKQLCLCVEQHVKENAAYFQFFSDARESETYLRNLQDSIKRKYSCDHNTSLTRLEDLLQDSMDEKEQLIQSKSSVASLVGRSKTIVQLRPRNPEHLVKSTIPIKAVCDYRQIEITICRNDECVLEDNSQRTKWKVISPTGNEAMVPSVCFLIPPPNKEAIEMANRVEQLYQKVMALWHQLHMNTKSLISWNYLRKDIALVQSFTQGECQQAMKSLQAHYEDFLQDSRDSELFSVSDRLRLEEEVESSKEHIRHLLESMENEDKDETVARTYLSELKNIRLRLEECEQRLVGRIQSPSSARADGDTIQENTIRIAEQEVSPAEDLQRLQSDLRFVSERCYSFLDKAPAGPSTPHLRSELDLVVNKMDQMHGLSSIYLDKLKTVDVIIRNTQGAESLVKGYEVKLSQEEAVPADLAAIQSHRAALQQWLGEVKDKSSVFSTLEEEMAKAKAVGEQLYRLRQERSIDLERYQEKGSQLWDRWQRVCAQIETRHAELESIQEVLGDYRQCHGALIQWIEEITVQQELMKPGQAEDSRVLSEQLSQQTALAAEIEKNQAKLDQCQKFSQQYSAAVKDYELQLMTYRAFVESQQKSPMKRRRMLSSSDAITQEFMDLRTRYTALVTLTTQHVKYISDALRRLEEEEVRGLDGEEKQEHVDKVKELLGWALGLKELGDIEKSISEQQALNEELAAKKEQVSEAIKTSQIFLAKHSHKLSHPEKEQISAQIGALKETYQALCSDSMEQLQQLQSQLGSEAVAGVIDLGTVEIFPVFGAMQRGLIDQDTGLVLLEAQVITSDLVVPETNEKLSLEKGLARNIIDLRTFRVLRELKDALHRVEEVSCEGRQLLPVVAAIEEGRISESIGLKILEAELVTGGFKVHQGRISMETAVQEKLLTPQLYSRLLSHLESSKDLIDPNTAEKISLPELMHRCIIHQETGLRLLPIKQLAGGMVSLKSGRKVSIFRAVQEGLIDRQVTVRLLEAHLFAGGIVDPRTGHRLTVDEAVRHNLIDQDLACTLLIRQLQTGGIIDTVTGERLTIDEAVRKELVAPRIALVVLESLWSFMGLLWPETGEIIPVADALEQGILSTELVYKILSKRQLIKAVFIPETTEVLSWKKAVEHGILERDVAKKLKSTAIPDVMAGVQLAGSPGRSRHGQSPSERSPTGHKEPSEPLLSSEDERLMFHLMTHSYINIHDGQKLLLVDGELNNLTKALIQTQENGSRAHTLEGSEDFEDTKANATLEREPCNDLALQQLEFQFIMFSKKMCLEHDEKLISYLSMLRDIEMRIKRVQPAEQNLAALHNLLQQAEVSEAGPGLARLGWRLEDRAHPPLPSFVHSRCTSSLTYSGCTLLPARMSYLKLAVQESAGCRVILLTGLFSPIQELKEPLADTKSQLDATAFDIQFLISEHAQDLTPQQSRQLLRLLNELQKAFRDLSERVTARVEVLQVCLQQVEQTDQVKVVRHLLPGCSLLAEALPSHQNELQRNMHTRAASFASVLKSTEEFLEENKAKMEPGELAALQEKLQRAKEQYRSLQERTEMAQKELESAVTAAVQQETEKVTCKELSPWALLEVDREVQSAQIHFGSWYSSGQKSCLEATREMVTRFMEAADSPTASALQGKLAEVTEHFGRLCQQQREREDVLKGLLPKVEQYEQLSEKLQQFTESRARMLASGNQPDRDIARFSQHVQVRCRGRSLRLPRGLGKGPFCSDFFPKKDASSCQEQLDEFRKLVGAVRKWLRESEGKMPPAETSLGTQELHQHRQQIQVGRGSRNQTGKVGSWCERSRLGRAARAAVLSSGCFLETDLTEIQCDVSDVTQQYQSLGVALQERQQQLSAMLEKMQEVQEEASSMLKWLESKERTLSELDASSSPTKTETVRAQAEHNKAFLAELEQNSGKIQKVKEELSGLLEKYPDSPEAANWKKMQEDLSKCLNQATAERQQKLEESANQLATFQAAEAQLRPWLLEKELMMSVLGPLSIDPNMLNAQKQQVQFMLKEFEARRQQHEQLNQAAQSILTGPGDVSPSTNQVREELQGVNQKWSELMERLNSRSSQIDQAIVKSTQYQELLQGLSEKVKAVGQRLSSQSAISTQPDAVKQQLEETSEIRSDLEQLEEEIAEAQTLCDDLSVLIGEQYLKDELRKRLETVALPLKGLEDLAADRMNRLQTALASSQQFQHMFDELRTWLDDKLCQQARNQPISAKLERLQSQIQEQEEFQKSLNQHSGSYEMIVAEGESLLLSVQPGEEKTTLQNQLVSLKTHWEELSKQAADRHSKLKDCLQKAQKYQRHTEDLLPWVEDCKAKMSELEVTLDPVQLEATLLRSKALLSDVEKRRSLLEMLNSAADILIDASQTDEDDIRDEKAGINQKMDAITEELQAKTGSIEEMSQRLKEFQESFKNIEKKLEGAKHQLEIYDALGPQACSNKNLEKLRAQQEVLQALEPQVDYLKNFTQGLVEDAPDGSDCSQLLSQAEVAQQDFKAVKQKVNDCCTLMENKLEGIGQFNNRVREMFSQLADLDDELDSMGPIGRDTDSLQSQAEDVRTFLGKLHRLKSDIEASESECKKMLEDEGSPDLLGLKRELETLNKQCSKLTERGKNRQEQVETTLSRVEDFYGRLKELTHMTTAAEENEALQWVVGTEVETINQQLADFKLFQKEQVDPLQLKLQQVNGVGQGLIQSAGKNCDVQGLEHDMEEINTRWNTLNKKVAQRVAQLQEALLHCGKFQDALEPLLSWLADTEELISNQKPPSAEYKVVKAQIQEQKLLQRLLDDRKATVEMIQAEGGRIAQSAEPADREKIVGQLESLERRWAGLLGRAAGRQKQLEDILVLAKQFHETTEPVSDWLSVTEKKLANSEPIGTQTAKIQQQISRHKALEEEIESHVADVSRAVGVGQSLSSLSCAAERRLLAEKLDSLQSRYGEVHDRCCRKAALLDQALSNARLFGEEEVEVLNWLAEVEDKLGSVSVKDYKRDVLQKQHADQLALNEEIVNRKKNVDQAIRNGQALLKQTTGEEVLLIQEKLDGIKTRYSDITAASSKALRTLEQARQLATKFQSTHEELASWMSKVEDELASSGGQSPAGEQIPQFQQRQKELKKEVMEHRLVLDTVNEVSRALLELVPWRAREGLDKLVSDTNERYKLVSDTIKLRVEEIDAAIQRSQQYEQAADAELAWVAETKRKLMALGPIRLEQDQTTAQLQVQKAFSIDIIRHKDSMDELFSQRNEIFGTCGEEQKAVLQVNLPLLFAYEAVSQLNSERYARLERAQVLVNQFWETYEELNPWIEETQALISQLPPPAIDHEQLKQQQEDMRQLRESIAEHKPHIDKLLKIGPQLKDLNPEEGEMVQKKYSTAEAMYAKIKEEVCQRALALDEAVSQSTQFHDKIEPMLETLEALSSRLRMPPLIPAEVDKIRECISENKNATVELEKLQPSFEALKRRGEELIGRSQGADKDLAAKVIQDKLDQMVFFWEDIKARAEEREMKFLDVLELAEKFWYDMAALLTTIKDTQDIVHDLESPGIDPSIIKQQVEAAETIKEETDGLHEELEFIRLLGTDLIFACGETEKPEVKKSIDEMNNAWENLNKTWKERLEKLEEAMQSAVQYQDTLQAMFDWLDNAVIKLCNMSPVGTDLNTVKEQMNEMKEFKMEVYQQQIEMEKLNHQGELMLKKATDETDRDIIKEPLTELKHLWENLGEKIAHRQHKLEAALLALGQFQHALAELMAWLTHTEELLDAQKPINGDPKVIEVELAKHHVLKNDVLAHQATVETVNKAGNELLESSAGDDASSLRNRLEKLNSCWESVLQKTEEREQQLQSTLQQAQGFHGEIEDFLLWLTRMESQLSASKPTGGLPETAREQLNAHMVISQERFLMLLIQQAPVCQIPALKLLLSISNGKKSVSLERKVRDTAKLEEALALATDFQNSLQDFINWLTLAEQSLNIAPPASLILNAVLAQIDEHKVFANEVNAHRDRIIELDQTGNQLKFLSQKQDVVLIKNLLVSVQSRWEKVVQRSVERGRALDDARKRAKQFHEAWKKLIDWLEDAENHLDSELEISNDPDKIKLQLSKHKEFQKTLGGKQPVYDTTIRTGRALKEKALLPDDTQKLDNLLGEVRDKWDTVCGKSVERQHKLEEALLFSGQFMDALQALVDWLYKVEPQLAEDQPVHGDLDLVMNLMDAHKVFQKELGKRTGTVQVLKRSGRELIENSRDDTTWVKVQLQELSNRWDTVCKLSVSKQTRLEQALKQAEEFRTAVQMLLEWLSEAEQSLRFRGALPDDAEALQSLIDAHKEFMKKVEEKRADVNAAVGMGEVILAACHPDCITTIKHWITIIRARFEEVLTWAKQHQQRLEAALSELVANAELLEELLAWIQWAETTLIQRDQEPMPQNIDQVKALISEHQSFMEEMTRKQPDVDRVTKTYKRKATEPPHGPFIEKSRSNSMCPAKGALRVGSETKNPRINQLSARWQQVWLLALERQRKLNDALDRLEELKEFANFDFDVWRKKYMRWMNHKKSRVMDFFRRIDKDQDGKITRQEFIDGILASKFPTTKLEMTAVADIFDRDGDGYIDYYEFVAALHPNKDAYRPTTDADKIEDEVTRQVAQCKCAKRFQVEQIGENKYRVRLRGPNAFGDSQQLRLVRILRSTVMVRVGGGWMALDEFLVKNDPCRGKRHSGEKMLWSPLLCPLPARGRTNLELREKFILPEGASQGMTPFRSRGRRSKPSSRAASPTRSSSSASQSNHSCASMPSSPATPASGAKTPHHFSRCYDKPWLINSKAGTPLRGFDYPDFQLPSAEVEYAQGWRGILLLLLSLLTALSAPLADPKKTASRPTSRAGSRTGSRASSRRGSDASDFDLLETQSACSDTSESSVAGGQGSSRRGMAKPSKIPTMSKKTTTATPKTPGPKR
uniref:Microtubule actin crosslinking factor 1 n=1 Tax=Athene cunicularia TaxID=194338 RepID=A0A663N7I8_ATHCN